MSSTSRRVSPSIRFFLISIFFLKSILSEFTIHIRAKENAPCIIVRTVDSKFSEILPIRFYVKKGSDFNFSLNILDDSGKTLHEFNKLQYSSVKIERKQLSGNFLHFCISNFGSDKLIQIHTLDSEEYDNNLFQKSTSQFINEKEKTRDYENFSSQTENEIDNQEIEFLKQELMNLNFKLEKFRSQVQYNDFRVQSATDFHGLFKKVIKTSLLSLCLVPIFFGMMFLASHYIVEHSDKRD
ncbi:MAG: hypothetical protein MHMPM18_004138 [Marteilia pararefringens]